MADDTPPLADGAVQLLQLPSTSLMIRAPERDALRALRDMAALHPVDMKTLMVAIKTPEGKRKHKEAMTRQTVHLPVNFFATYSVEVQRDGLFRHLSVSIAAGTGVPNPEAVWMIAEALGFVGAISNCIIKPEKMPAGYMVINVLQAMSAHPGPSRPQ